jgi:hypothetical protein
MTKRSFRVSVLVTGIVLSGAVAVPAFAQNYGLIPRGACPKITPSASYTPPARAQQSQQSTAYDVAYASPTPAPAPQRPKRARGLGSPF